MARLVVVQQQQQRQPSLSPSSSLSDFHGTRLHTQLQVLLSVSVFDKFCSTFCSKFHNVGNLNGLIYLKNGWLVFFDDNFITWQFF